MVRNPLMFGKLCIFVAVSCSITAAQLSVPAASASSSAHPAKPLYELAIAKGGSKLHEATPGGTYPNGPDGISHAGMMLFDGPGHYTAQAVPASNLEPPTEN